MVQLNGLIGAEPFPAAIDTQQLAHGVTKLLGVPLWIIRAGFVAVAYRHALHVGFAQKMKHYAQTLGTDADERDVHLVTGWHIACATQHPARNDGNSDSRCSALRQELASRN